MVNIIVVYQQHALLGGEVVDQWKEENRGFQYYHQWDDVAPPEISLFSEPPPTFISCSSFTLSNINNILKNFPSKSSVLIVSEKKSSANLSKKVSKIHDYTLSKDRKSLIKQICIATGVNEKMSRECINSSKTPLSALLMAVQSSYRETPIKNYGELVELSRGDVPPWRIIDSLTQGDIGRVIDETQSVIQQGVKPTALMFQLIGYIRKVITSHDSPMFTQKRKNISDLDGLILDMSTYPDKVMSNSKVSESLLLSMVASMASRFQ